MNTHPMKYVSMINRLLEEDLHPADLARLRAERWDLIQAAKQEAYAYGGFKDHLKALAPSNELAAKFHEKTYLDLT